MDSGDRLLATRLRSMGGMHMDRRIHWRVHRLVCVAQIGRPTGNDPLEEGQERPVYSLVWEVSICLPLKIYSKFDSFCSRPLLTYESKSFIGVGFALGTYVELIRQLATAQGYSAVCPNPGILQF